MLYSTRIKGGGESRKVRENTYEQHISSKSIFSSSFVSSAEIIFNNKSYILLTLEETIHVI